MSAAAANFMEHETQADIINQVAFMLDFLSEALSALAIGGNVGLSSDGAEGLACICQHISQLCRNAPTD